MESRTRVLIAGLTHTFGGMENYVMNLYRHIDRELIQFDYINNIPGEKIPFQDEIQTLGGRVYDVPILRKGIIKHYAGLYKVFRSNQYKALYYHAGAKLKNTDYFQFALRNNVPIRILHVHAVSNERKTTGLQRIRELRAQKKKDSLITHRFACSKEAGEWMFEEKPFLVLANGIDTDRFDYNVSVRQKIRAENGIAREKVYGTVARLEEVKNPLFLIDVFYEIHKLQPESRFWHIGGGPLRQEMQEKINMLGLSDSYFLFGIKENVSDYLNAMDLFVFPSKFEGFGIALLEAQTSGLKCLASDTIFEAVNVTGNVTFCSLQESAGTWAETAVKLSDYSRESGKSPLLCTKYDIRQTAKDFQDFILEH